MIQEPCLQFQNRLIWAALGDKSQNCHHCQPLKKLACSDYDLTIANH
jgi:hypothetical protein